MSNQQGKYCITCNDPLLLRTAQLWHCNTQPSQGVCRSEPPGLTLRANIQRQSRWNHGEYLTLTLSRSSAIDTNVYWPLREVWKAWRQHTTSKTWELMDWTTLKWNHLTRYSAKRQPRSSKHENEILGSIHVKNFVTSSFSGTMLLVGLREWVSV